MNYNLIKAIEFDKYAVHSYNAIFNTEIIPTDITTVREIPNCDFLTYGFPCQDVSLQGKLAGIKQGTRSGLLYEVERLLGTSKEKPKFLLMENVKGLVSKKYIYDFNKWLETLESFGYVNYWKVMNSLDYGVPQNRERVFVFSVRKDIDCGFEFPNKINSDLTMQDLLVENVDERFYLTDFQIKAIGKSHYNVTNRRIQKKPYCDTLCASDPRHVKCVQAGVLSSKRFDKMYDSSRRVYYTKGASPTLQVCGGGNTECKIVCNDGRVRKLTPQEYWRLQDFDDFSFFKAQSVNSNSQLYKQAGNTITIKVLVEIYKQIQRFYPIDFVNDINVVTLFSGIGAFEKALERL